MIIGLDSNVIAYFCEVARIHADHAKVAMTQELLRRFLGSGQLIVPVQALGELYNLLLKSGASRDDALDRVTAISMEFSTVDTSAGLMEAAMDLACRHKLQIWDAVMIEASREAGARYLLSEDMQDGFRWRGLTVLDPFGPNMEAALFG